MLYLPKIFNLKQYYTIPIFIPEKACPFRCTYCNQYKIADTPTVPDAIQTKTIIEKYLKTIPSYGIKRIAFFGGSFTGMSIEEQNKYLDIATPYIDSGEISSIQLSTRPDYITEDILENLKGHGVKIIELGAQSLDEAVLKATGRGHTAYDIERAAEMIRSYGFSLGLQMMIGLPEDTPKKSMETANKIIRAGAKYTRIYPTLVIKDTVLEKLFHQGKYTPLSLAEAVSQCKDLLLLFEKHGIEILRTGLHPSEGLINGENLVAGPFHVSFKELVYSEIWRDIIISKLADCDKTDSREINISVAPSEINYAIGYGSSNREFLKRSYNKVSFKADSSISGRGITIR